MNPKPPLLRAISLTLLGFGLFQIIASMVAFLFLMLTGSWRDDVPQIIALTFTLAVPLGYHLWKNYFDKKFLP